MLAIGLGESIPRDTAHAVSVSLPTWQANVAYEEGEEWVVGRMTSGYPRFFINRTIETLANAIITRYHNGGNDLKALVFPSPGAARRCADFVHGRLSHEPVSVECIDLGLDTSQCLSPILQDLDPKISAVVCGPDAYKIAREYWQHTGEGVSSRRAEFCHILLQDGLLVLRHLSSSRNLGPLRQNGAFVPEPAASTRDRQVKAVRGPKRYLRSPTAPTTVASHLAVAQESQPAKQSVVADHGPEEGASHESLRFLEERYGRNLDLALAKRASSAIKRRLAGALAVASNCDVQRIPPALTLSPPANARGVANLSEENVYLFPCGMNAIFNIHRCLLSARGGMKSINFGFPYVDTLKVLQKFGPGCVFYGNATDDDLDALEARLRCGERFSALFCEFPGNPLLTCPNLGRIRLLADEFDIVVVVDDTIGNMANISVMLFADVVVSSLTKIFSGDCNVMGGAVILNPQSCWHSILKAAMASKFEDNYWPEDVIFMERNSRDYRSRIRRINANSEAICQVLQDSAVVKKVYYPKYNETRDNYDACKLPGGGYGGLLSIAFHQKSQAMAFYDALGTAKGPSLGTNFTLTSPYVILAHYRELEWASQFGIDPNLVRVSVGLEKEEELAEIFRVALGAALKAAEN